MRDLKKTISRRGYVYFVETDDARFMKIGFSTRPYQRFDQITQGLPSLRFLGCVQGSMALEQQLHAQFAADHEKCEWFRGSTALREFVSSLSLIPFESLDGVPGPPSYNVPTDTYQARVKDLPARLQQPDTRMSELVAFVKAKTAQYRERSATDPAIVAAKAIIELWTVPLGAARKPKSMTLGEIDAIER